MPAELKEKEHEQAEQRSAVRAHVVHEAVVKQGEDELDRSSSALAWSGLAAGRSMSLSFLAESALRAHLPDTEWRPLVAKFGYTLGFLVVILGRQQLFRENTLTPVLPLLHKKPRATATNVLRLWVVVLLANMAGTHFAAGSSATRRL
jgi:formate-nitrite transporter family protein